MLFPFVSNARRVRACLCLCLCLCDYCSYALKGGHVLSSSHLFPDSNYGDCKGCCNDDEGCCDSGCACGNKGCSRAGWYGITCSDDYCRRGTSGVEECTKWPDVTAPTWTNVQQGLICRGNYDVAPGATTAEECKAACVGSGTGCSEFSWNEAGGASSRCRYAIDGNGCCWSVAEDAPLWCAPEAGVNTKGEVCGRD